LHWAFITFKMATVPAETILITGAGSGIGLALAECLLAEGHRVIGTFRRDTPSPELEELRDRFDRLQLERLDVTNDASTRRARDRVADRIDQLDVLVNNAGIMPADTQSGLEDIDLTEFQRCFDVHVTGVARVTREFLPLLRRSRNPRVLNLSSRAASIADKENGINYAYGASKAALNMLTRTLANEFRGDRLIVAAISPGWVRTRMTGPHAPLSVEESAASLARTLERLGPEHSGQFHDRFGETAIPW